MWTIFIVEIVTVLWLQKTSQLLTCSTTVHLETYERIPDIPSQVTRFSTFCCAKGRWDRSSPGAIAPNCFQLGRRESVHLWLDWLPVACCLVKGLLKKLKPDAENRYFLTKKCSFWASWCPIRAQTSDRDSERHANTHGVVTDQNFNKISAGARA